jgi:hypothetical protein
MATAGLGVDPRFQHIESLVENSLSGSPNPPVLDVPAA